MARNEVFYDATHVSLQVSTPPAGAVLSGDPVRVGIANFVAQTDVAVDNTAGNPVGVNGMTNSNEAGFASLNSTGCWNVPVTVTGTVAVGDAIYATTNGTNKKVALTNVASGNKLWGWAFAATGTAGAQTLPVVLIPFAV
jgi:hypothetical protein